MHGPSGPVNSSMLAAGDGIHQFALLVEDFHFQFAEHVACPLLINSGFSDRNEEMSSMIQMPRPCVAKMRSDSRGCTTMSRTATAGKLLPLYWAQCSPPSMLIHKPNSVPRNSSRGSTVSSLMTCA